MPDPTGLTGRKIKVALYPYHSSNMGDKIFDLNSDSAKSLRGLPVIEPFVELQKFLNQKNIEIHTYDMFKNFREVDAWIMLDPGKRKFLFALRHLINPRKIIFGIFEPEVTNPWAWQYLKFYVPFHKVFLSWSNELAEKYPDKFIDCKIPVPFPKDKYDYFKSQPKRNLCLLMQSNKCSKIKGELYSLRRQIIRYFEKRGDGLLDLYGFGWNTQNFATDFAQIRGTTPFYTNIYKGISEDKWETFAQYHFTFCIQNAVPAGDFEYDPFMAMATGTVPVFLPPPNTDQYIPRETYINYNDFKNLDELTDYLQSLAGTEKYEKYRRAGWEYINSEKYESFTIEKFCLNVHQAIERVIKK